MQYKVLSVLQPWASLVVMGAKQIETRSWNTKHRGLLLIHASLSWKAAQKELIQNEPFRSSLANKPDIWGISQGYCFGAIIGSVILKDTHTTDNHQSPTFLPKSKIIKPWEEGRGVSDSYLALTEQEHAFGDYSPGRYGWLLSDPVMFKDPIPCKGSLGLWTPDEETDTAIYHQLHPELIYEQELPDLTREEYGDWHKTSRVINGLRMGPRI